MAGRLAWPPEPSYFEYTAADAGSLASLSREPSVPGTRLGLPLDRVREQALKHAAPEMLSRSGRHGPVAFFVDHPSSGALRAGV